ncbi:MAG: PLP-dependent aminotransferase family protein [Blastocatellia bacterium]|nr:PLP-dependent aminotransferase family protein [Blastocatellia bacterium]
MDIAITLDHGAAQPLHAQIYEELRGAILTGRLKAGERVASTRALARSLRVSRTTVTQSYERLISEGYLWTAVGSGTSVCRQLPEELSRPAPTTIPSGGRPTRKAAPSLSALGRELAAIVREPKDSALQINFKYCHPAVDHFPMQLWRRLLLRQYRGDDARLLDYADDGRGFAPLREAIARYLGRSRAVRCDADQVIIVNGSQQGLSLTAQVLLDRGDAVGMENPGYLGARHAFLAQGARIHPLPVDEAGLQVERLAAFSSGSRRAALKLVYVTPSHQFPTGAILSLPRRLELLAWAESNGAWIVEDDYDSEFRYDSRPMPCLQGLAENDSVIYIGTFSKILFPSLRIGYLVVPRPLVEVYEQAKWLSDRHTPTIEQWALADFIGEGHLESHLRRMRVLYDQRRQALVRALQRHFGDRVTILGENSGMHLMIRLCMKIRDEQFLQFAAAAGVGINSARLYQLDGTLDEARENAGRGEFVLGYAALSERKIQEGIRRLSLILAEHETGRS